MTNTAKSQNIGLLALRLSVGLIFLMQGWGKLNAIEMPTALLDGIGFPAAGFFAWLLAVTEFLGGIGLILGIWVRCFAKLLFVVMLVALFTVHIPGSFAGAMTPIALLGSTLAVALLGGGAWQLMKDRECLPFCRMGKK